MNIRVIRLEYALPRQSGRHNVLVMVIRLVQGRVLFHMLFFLLVDRGRCGATYHRLVRAAAAATLKDKDDDNDDDDNDCHRHGDDQRQGETTRWNVFHASRV